MALPGTKPDPMLRPLPPIAFPRGLSPEQVQALAPPGVIVRIGEWANTWRRELDPATWRHEYQSVASAQEGKGTARERAELTAALTEHGYVYPRDITIGSAGGWLDLFYLDEQTRIPLLVEFLGATTVAGDDTGLHKRYRTKLGAAHAAAEHRVPVCFSGIGSDLDPACCRPQRSAGSGEPPLRPRVRVAA